MSTTIVPLAADIERVLIGGDLAKLSPDQRVAYYRNLCESLGLNPLSRPFDYLNLNGKLTLYAKKDATDQLRAIKGVSVYKLDPSESEGVYSVVAYAELANGRKDSDIGAVDISGLKGEKRANAMMKATTKAKRRVTLSICGLGFLDEMEVETIPGAYKMVVDDAGTIEGPVPSKEAQDAYLQKRLEEVRKPKDNVPAEVKDWANIDPGPER